MGVRLVRLRLDSERRVLSIAVLFGVWDVRVELQFCGYFVCLFVFVQCVLDGKCFGSRYFKFFVCFVQGCMSRILVLVVFDGYAGIFLQVRLEGGFWGEVGRLFDGRELLLRLQIIFFFLVSKRGKIKGQILKRKCLGFQSSRLCRVWVLVSVGFRF